MYRLGMTGQEIRDLGYLKWKDPLAWMESMKGKKWENILKQEKNLLNYLISENNVKPIANHMEKEILIAQEYMKLPSFRIACGTIDIFFTSSARFIWRWSWNKKGKPAYDIDVQGNIVWYITSDEDEHFTNSLICEDSNGKKIWSKSAVSSQIAIVGELCYYVRVTDYFRTVELCVCNSQTGNNEKVLYREKDKSRDIVLIKGANKTLYFKSEDPVDSQLYKINGYKYEQLAKSYSIVSALGESIYGDDCLLVKKTRQDKWIFTGKPLSDWILPDESIDWISLETGHVLTMNEGAQTIWLCSPRKKPNSLFKIKVGTIEPNIWTIWENSLVQSFIIKSPFDVPYMIHIINNKVTRDERKIQINHPMNFKPLEVHRFHATSKDGTKVPYILIKQKNSKPKAQLIYIYGAYGSSTPINWPYNQWGPLLNRNWVLIFALVRGGGDVDEAWAEMARRNNRHVVIEDFEAIIQAAQDKNKLDADKTVIYGRSAGGLPVGAIVAKYPNGQLVGAAFTEVPYVDILRTSSNPELPLTIGEFKEFGNPLERILNFKELLSVSPINTLPLEGAPGVFVFDRVGLLDKQVYAYESFKWIQRLRGYSKLDGNTINDAKGKYVAFEKNEAHHYKPQTFPRFRAIDLAILDLWAEGKLKL